MIVARAPAWRDDASRLALDQAAAAVRNGDTAEAACVLRARLSEEPCDADVRERLAAMALDDGRLEEALLLLQQAIAAEPILRREIGLTRLLLNVAGPAAALARVEGISEPLRSAFELRAFEAMLLGMVGEHDRQLAVYEELAELRQCDPVLRIHIGTALNTVGRSEEAEAALRRAIRIDPTFGAAYWTYANFKSTRFKERHVAAMLKALGGRIGPRDRVHFEFALGKAFEQRRRFGESFAHYAQGNALFAEGVPAEQLQVTSFVDSAIAWLADRTPPDDSGQSSCEPGPIFVMGLHRSGSTLIEQILASHPLIEGAGELPVMQQIWQRITRAAARSGEEPFAHVARMDAADFRALGAEYLERTRPFRRTDRPWFVDKLPANWLLVGPIMATLPNARMIDVRRHPMACGLANFKQLYETGVTYSYSLGSIGRFYRDYLRMMGRVDSMRPGAILHVVNERLIEDPEREIVRMLAYIGVPFDPACLDFHNNARAVRTPSAQQVRRPINRDGVDAWRAYEPWLDPLKAALGDALDGWMPSC